MKGGKTNGTRKSIKYKKGMHYVTLTGNKNPPNLVFFVTLYNKNSTLTQP